MKRHPALIALSTDHHHSLVQARRLLMAAERNTSNTRESTGESTSAPEQRLAGEDMLATASAFLTFWREEISRHFREEEEVLLPAFARYGDPADAPVVRVLVEHVRLRQLVDDLQHQLACDVPSPLPASMTSIGELLRAHVRYEEDILFPLIERTLPEEALQEILVKLA